MRKKNGFTLVELLAVIVVLALIMVIAIPSVLDAMNSARRNSFVLMVEKVVKDATTSYVTDSQSTIPGAGTYIYDIKNDFNYTSSGNYTGYVLVDATNVDEPHYVVYLYDANYMILGFDVTSSGKYPEAENISSYDRAQADAVMGNAVRVCNDWKDNDGGQCMNRKNYVLSEE